MNDVSMTRGQFQEDVYVHLTVTQTDGLTDMFCTCAMYGVLLQMARISLPDKNLDEVNLTNLKCCHIRLFDDMISDHMPSLITISAHQQIG